jgi:hypothetical protein
MISFELADEAVDNLEDALRFARAARDLARKNVMLPYDISDEEENAYLSNLHYSKGHAENAMNAIETALY